MSNISNIIRQRSVSKRSHIVQAVMLVVIGTIVIAFFSGSATKEHKLASRFVNERIQVMLQLIG